jgi:hypothetical protein
VEAEPQPQQEDTKPGDPPKEDWEGPPNPESQDPEDGESEPA